MSEQNSPRGRKYLHINELSQITGFSITQIRRLVAAKKIPFFQPGGKGGKLLFPENAIECCLTDSVTPPADETDKPLPGRRPKWMKD